MTNGEELARRFGVLDVEESLRTLVLQDLSGKAVSFSRCYGLWQRAGIIRQDIDLITLSIKKELGLKYYLEGVVM